MIGLENPLHIALILIVVLMVFGAKRLPEMGKSLGGGLRGFKDALSGNETDDPMHELTAQPTPERTEERSPERTEERSPERVGEHAA